jgi:poly(3-hydroxybutyrate) depolymerase
MLFRRGSSFSLLAVGLWLAAASCGGSEDTPLHTSGAAGTGASGTAGTGAAGAGAGAAGTTGASGDTGASGSSGAAGDTGAAGSGSDTGAAGSGAGGSGAAGATVTGTAGGTGVGGGSATPGAAGATGTGGATGLTGMSAGCGMDPTEGTGKFNKHMVTVTGVASTVKAATGGASWTNRVYFLDLPSGYDSKKAYPILFGGGGCGGAINSNGDNGGFGVLPSNNKDAIQIGMSYVWPQGGGACFDDDGADTPDLPYFDAILKEVETNYCVDKGKVFVGGYSSGGWESYMLGLARGGVVRGIATAAGGLRMSRPPQANVPIAALLLTGGDDTTNPATGATGSDAAMSLIMQINGCTGTATVPWETKCDGCGCNRYTGCPAAYPVVRCRPPGQGHTDGGGNFKTAIWATWMSLPTP